MPKAVIIDDDEGVIEALEAALSLWGVESTGIKDAHTAVSTLLTVKPEIVFLDLLLSGIEGAQVAQQIRKVPELANVPIILMSAHPSAKEVSDYIPVDGFLAKPFNLDTLQSLIQKVSPSLLH